MKGRLLVPIMRQIRSTERARAARSHIRDERRQNPRFALTLSVLLRLIGDSWTSGRTANLGTAGGLILTDRPYLLGARVEYLVTFPPEMTKAPQPLFVRFFGTISRCERLAGEDVVFGVAVRHAAYRYLTLHETAASFNNRSVEVANKAITVCLATGDDLNKSSRPVVSL